MLKEINPKGIVFCHANLHKVRLYEVQSTGRPLACEDAPLLCSRLRLRYDDQCTTSTERIETHIWRIGDIGNVVTNSSEEGKLFYGSSSGSKEE
jgi:hypothetical protein